MRMSDLNPIPSLFTIAPADAINKLLTKRGRRLYKQRSRIIEPVFGQTKTCRGIDRFQRRGLGACDAEWKLLCGIHNLLKLWRHQTAQPLGVPATT